VVAVAVLIALDGPVAADLALLPVRDALARAIHSVLRARAFVHGEVADQVAGALVVEGAAGLALLGREVAIGRAGARLHRAVGDPDAVSAVTGLAVGARNVAPTAVRRIPRGVDASPVARALPCITAARIVAVAVARIVTVAVTVARIAVAVAAAADRIADVVEAGEPVQALAEHARTILGARAAFSVIASA